MSGGDAQSSAQHMSAAQQQQEAIIQQLTSGSAPWPSIYWSLGGHPSTVPDIPITAVFLVLYILGAAGHAYRFFTNKKKGYWFVFNALMMGLCFARITTCVLRIAWVTHSTNIQLGIAAQIFVAAGVLIVFIVNLFFTQRIVRARHPNFGWHGITRWVFRGLLILIPVLLAMLITATVQMFYTLSTNTRRIDRDIQLTGSGYFLFIAFLPIPVTLLSLVIPRSGPIDKFGQGRHRHQLAILLTGATIISIGAAFRLATSAKSPVPLWEPLPDYFSKACFYVFNFVIEIIVIYLYMAVRIDLRFHIPNGAKGPGSYGAGRNKEWEGEERKEEDRMEEGLAGENSESKGSDEA